ncbi:MAG: hypothetical protein QNK37_31655 [Acidobacteriota bacterium]|nr:hypothetical protein [Acidobacteriota bacterium]
MDENYIYIADGETNRIKQFTHTGEELRAFGGEGQGPGEFQGVRHLTVRDGLLFAMDYAFAVHVFDDQGEFIKKINLSSSVVETRGAVDHKMEVYVSSPESSKPISVYDLHGNFLRSFGEWLGERPQDIQRRDDNARFLFFNKAGNLVSVSSTAAEIEIYTPEGRRLHHRPLRYGQRFLSFFTRVEDYYEQHPEKLERTTFHLIQDAVLIDDHLMLLHHGNRENVDWEDLLVIEVSGAEIGKGRDVLLKGRDGGKIKGFRITGKGNLLHVYDPGRNWIFKYELPPAVFDTRGAKPASR